MKTLVAIISSFCLFLAGDVSEPMGPAHFWGAWEANTTIDGKEVKVVKTFTQSYFITAAYTETEFVKASGGTWTLTGKGIEETYEFDSNNPDIIGTTVKYAVDHSDENKMDGEFDGTALDWKRIDDARVDGKAADLFGAWRITGRERNGEMRTMQMGPRKTFKVCSGTRFQWAAYNVETKQFSGTGGGTYTFKDGKYTENIKFFSRDNSRVGASLGFDGEVKDTKNWHHSGLSSRGAPIYEIWTNQDKPIR